MRTPTPSGRRAARSPAQQHAAPPGRTPLLASILYAALSLGFVAAGLSPDPRPWGLHHLAFLPRGATVAAALLLALFAWPRLSARFGALALDAGARLVRSRLAVVGFAAACGILFWVARLEFHFLGDGGVWLDKISMRGVFHHFEPLSTAVVRWVALQFSTPLRHAGLVSVLCGVAYLVGAALLCRRLWQDDATRGLGWALLVVHPVLLLFCGYVESYPILLALQVWCLVLWESAQRSRAALAGLVLLLGVAIASHLLALAWLPALPALALATSGGKRRLRLAASAVSMLVALALALGIVWAIGARPGELARDLFGTSALGGIEAGWFFSMGHLLDLGNELVLLFGAAVLVAAAGRWNPSRHVWLAAGFGAGPLLAALLVPPRIGGARDWDLYLSLFLPGTLAAVSCSVRPWLAAQGGQGAAGLVAAGRAIGWTLVVTAAWLGVHLSEARTARRMEVLQDPRGTFSNFARGYANEGLGIYYRDRDLAAARRAYERAALANPKNARYFNNLANIEIRSRNIPAARAAFQKSYDLGLREWFVMQNLALCNLDLGEAVAAESLFVAMSRRWPRDWRASAGVAQARLVQGRPESALEELARALALAPREADVHYLVGLAQRDRGDLARARAAWNEALRFDAQHVAAREALARAAESP